MSMTLSPPPAATTPSRSSFVVLLGPLRRYFLRSPSATLAENICSAPQQKLEQQELIATPLAPRDRTPATTDRAAAFRTCSRRRRARPPRACRGRGAPRRR